MARQSLYDFNSSLIFLGNYYSLAPICVFVPLDGWNLGIREMGNAPFPHSLAIPMAVSFSGANRLLLGRVHHKASFVFHF